MVDPKSHHGFSTTKPITMWDANTLQVIKMIDVDGRPDGIMFDPYNERVWVLSHMPPYATVIDAKEGTVVGTVDLVGTAEQAVSDGKGTVYINISDKGGVAVVNAKTLKVTANYDLSAKGVHGSGMSVDAKNHILFAYYRDPKPVVAILNAENGNVITTFPTGEGVDTVAFNPATMEAISASNGGAMTFIKENSPTNFVVEQTLETPPGAKTMTLDTKTGHIFTMTAEYAAGRPQCAARPGRTPGARPHGAGFIFDSDDWQVEGTTGRRTRSGSRYLALPSRPLPTGSANSLSYAAVSEGTHSISGMSKPGGCNRTENLSMATQGFVYILGSSIVTLICK